MGSYCSFTLKEWDISWDKNSFDRTVLELFSPMELIQGFEKIDGTEREYTKFRTTADKIKTRLEVLGCNEVKLKKYIEEGIAHFRIDSEEYGYEDKQRDAYYAELSYEKYVRALKMLLSTKDLKRHYFNEEAISGIDEIDNNPIALTIWVKRGSHINAFIYEDIDEISSQWIDVLLDYYMYFCHCDPEYIVEYDLSDVIEGGWVELDNITKFYENFNDTTVILAEGINDIRILSRSLEVLYPEHMYLFTFFDFEHTKPGGGAPQLATLVKSLSAAKIKNRIIAIFDNDTAAANEILHLKKVHITENIKVMQLPFLETCADYPTHGPTGIVNMNINGKAVSIEHFAGNEILSDKEGYKIIWQNYSPQTDSYHGAITKKEIINEAIVAKLKSPDMETQDWSSLKLLWDTIFKL